jgi:hypothetical protein
MVASSITHGLSFAYRNNGYISFVSWSIPSTSVVNRGSFDRGSQWMVCEVMGCIVGEEGEAVNKGE